MAAPFVHIVILNWKKPQDTIECLASLERISYQNYGIILLDNNSEDGSDKKIENWLINSAFSFKKHRINENTHKIESPDFSKKVQLILNYENSGFAKANNIGIDLAMQANADLVLLLNNDTEVTEAFLDILIEGRSNNADISVFTPQIRLYNPKDTIWNCGGKLILGGFWKKYYYNHINIKHIEERSALKPITFVTGCSLLFDPREMGKLTEDFFFGEEDFEFSLRAKKNKKKIACVMNSIIYHKVGTSIDSKYSVGKRYTHILNRLVNTRKNNFNLAWPFLMLAIVSYNFFELLRKEKMGLGPALNLSVSLIRDSIKLDEVNQDKFMGVLLREKW